MNALIEQCRLAGIRLWVEDGTIRYDAPRGAMTPELVTALKTKRLALLDALAHPDPLPPVPRGLAGYATPPGVPPLGDCELARQLRDVDASGAEVEDLREFFEERAGILEHDAGMPRPEAEAEAARIATAYAKNRGHTWVSLRAALSRYSVLAAQLPNRPGPHCALQALHSLA